MADRNLKDLLQNVYDVHRKDIKTYASGHLNPAKLLKPQEAVHSKWDSSDKPMVRLRPPTCPVNLPVRKGELTLNERKQKNMADCLVEFSLGPMGKTAPVKEALEGLQGRCTGESAADTVNPDKLPAHVEELRLPEIMLPAITKKRGLHRHSRSDGFKHTFVDTYLSHPTKTDQFASFKEFGNQVMNLGDAHDRGVLTGEKKVRILERRLAKDLVILDSMSQRGPNFHRLQLYNKCFDDIIQNSDTFGPLLQEIKDEYDSYMSYLLDSQRPSQHKALYHHIDSLSQNQNASDELKAEQKRVGKLEKQAKQLLDENARLKRVLQEELEKTAEAQENLSTEPHPKTHIRVEEVPKDLEEQVEELHTQILAQLDIIEDIKRHQKEFCVPISVCQHLEQCIKETEVDIQKILKQNEFLEQTIEDLEQDLETVLDRSEIQDKDARHMWKKINTADVIQISDDRSKSL